MCLVWRLCPSGVQGQSPWSGDQGRTPWSWTQLSNTQVNFRRILIPFRANFRKFACYAGLHTLCVWNSLPTAVQSAESLDIFRRHLKTELFERSYNSDTAPVKLLRDSLSPSRRFLLWPQPWSLSTIMLLWHSFLIIIIIIMTVIVLKCARVLIFLIFDLLYSQDTCGHD